MPSELEVNRANTKAFIDADPVSVVFERKDKESDGEGGYVWGEGVLPAPEPQTMRLIPQSDSMPVIQTPDGFQRTPGYVLLGEWNSSMEIWDYFTIGTTKYQIVSPIRPVHTDNAYEKKGDVALV